MFLSLFLVTSPLLLLLLFGLYLIFIYLFGPRIRTLVFPGLKSLHAVPFLNIPPQDLKNMSTYQMNNFIRLKTKVLWLWDFNPWSLTDGCKKLTVDGEVFGSFDLLSLKSLFFLYRLHCSSQTLTRNASIQHSSLRSPSSTHRLFSRSGRRSHLFPKWREMERGKNIV